MAAARGIVRWLGILVVLCAVLAAGGVWALTRTDPGVERAAQLVLDRLREGINGTLTVGDVEAGSLLSGALVRDVVLRDARGELFVRADSVRLAYRLRSFLRGAVVFDRTELYGPEIRVERLPGEPWNYERIFTQPADTIGPREPPVPVLLRDVTIRDGRAVVRTPWHGDGDTRMVLDTVPGGVLRVLRFDSIDARVPDVVWQTPESPTQTFEIAALSFRAFLFPEPARIRDLQGRVTVRDSVVDVDAERVRLPGSELSVQGQAVTGAAGVRYDFQAQSGDLAVEDLRWLRAELPTGEASLRFRMQSLTPDRTLWLAQDVELRTGPNELAGSFGVVTGDTLYFTDVELRATPLDIDDLDAVLPAEIPFSGLVIGDIAFEGHPSALRTRGDARYRTFTAEGDGAESDLTWDGTIGFDPPYVLRGLEAELRAVDLTQVAHFQPELRIRGVVSGTVEADGSIREGLELSGQLRLDHQGRQSAVRGSGRMALGDAATFDLQVDAEPVSLRLLAIQFPALDGLDGDARGPVTLAGTLDDLTVSADLATPAGELTVQGGLNLAGARPSYRAEGSVSEFRLDRVASELPETTVTGRFDVEGEGFDPAEAETRVSADVLAARVAGVAVYRGALRGSVVRGLARVDSLTIATEVGDATVRGTFGLRPEESGELAVQVRADSLLFLEPVLFPDDPVDLELNRARVDGLVSARGTIAGNLEDWSSVSVIRLRSVVYDRLEVRSGQLDVAWRADSLTVEATLDSIRHGTRRLASARASLQYANGSGTFDADVQGRRAQRLRATAGFRPQGEEVAVDLTRFILNSRQGEWVLARPAAARVGAGGFRVDSLTVNRDPGPARIRVAGVLPWLPPEADEVQPASLEIEVDEVRLGELLAVSQSDTLVDGVVTGRLEVRGTALHPQANGRVFARSFRYGGAVLDSVRGQVEYSDRHVQGRFAGWEAGDSIVVGQLRVPIELALTEREDRLLAEPMRISIRAAGVPAGLLAFLAPGFEGVDGRIEGTLNVAGTTVEPDLQGTLRLVDGTARFQPLNVAYRNVQATARMDEGSTVGIDATLTTENGRGRIQGTLDLQEPTDPVFDLQVEGQRLDAARRRDVTVVVDGRAGVQGRYTRPVVSGNVRVLRGEMNLDEVWRQYQIVQLDTTLFQMLDTAQVSYTPQQTSPFLRNLRVTNTTVTTDRNFWLRSRELNVEVGGTLAMEMDRQADDLRLTGTLQIVEGNYQLLAQTVAGVGSRRFDIRSGTIEFVGTPGIDPNLDIEAAYRVRRAQGEPINVLAEVSGTLQDPRVQLSSDAEIPLSETDLASYILFGRSSAELTQSQTDILGTSGLAASFFRPVMGGVASSWAQQLTTTLGLPVDYVALNFPEFGPGGAPLGQDATGLNPFQNAQIELGFDLSSNVSVVGSYRLLARDDASFVDPRSFGARVEYRPWQTWTVEGFIEDQFARTPSFGTADVADRKVIGLTLFREWGY